MTWKCGECKQTFDDYEALYAHIEVNHQEKLSID